MQAGQIDRDEYSNYLELQKLNQQENLGYAFVTFSHADEAKQAMLQIGSDLLIHNNLVSVMPKGKLEHSEMDMSYFMRKVQSDSKIVEQKEKLREAKKNLREFERNFDEEMPQNSRLQDFK